MKSFRLFVVFMAFGLMVQTASAQVSFGLRGGRGIMIPIRK